MVEPRATAEAQRKMAADLAHEIVAAMERYKGHTEKAVSKGKTSYTGSVTVKIRKSFLLQTETCTPTYLRAVLLYT
jgi:hypothetical protein